MEIIRRVEDRHGAKSAPRDDTKAHMSLRTPQG